MQCKHKAEQLYLASFWGDFNEMASKGNPQNKGISITEGKIKSFDIIRGYDIMSTRNK